MTDKPLPQPTPAEPRAIWGIPVRLDPTFAKDEMGIERNGKIVARVKVPAAPRIETEPEEWAESVIAGLLRYAGHQVGCSNHRSMSEQSCTCGFREIMEMVKAWRARAGSSLSPDLDRCSRCGEPNNEHEDEDRHHKFESGRTSPPSSPGAAPIVCESNSITYAEDREPDKCPTCHGYHRGGCHRVSSPVAGTGEKEAER